MIDCSVTVVWFSILKVSIETSHSTFGDSCWTILL